MDNKDDELKNEKEYIEELDDISEEDIEDLNNLEDENLDKKEEKEDERKDNYERKNKKQEDLKNEDTDEEIEEYIRRIKESRNKGIFSFRIKPPTFFAIILLLIALMYYSFGSFNFNESAVEKITYTQFVDKIKQGDINSVKETDTELIGIKRSKGEIKKYSTVLVTSRLGHDTNLMNLLEEKNVDIEVTGRPLLSSILYSLIGFLPFILLIFFFIYINRKISGSMSGGMGNPLFGMVKGKSKISEKPNVKFEDVAGLKEEKEELKEIVEFLKNPEKFEKVGARVPKGILLLGEPGTGKTLLAKAVAGESGASFFSISGSEFVEIYVGMGASRVRELFREAKKETPAIIFIDEIDAVGRKRSQNKNGGGNDEREQTLNQLLVEMDGFETDERIIILAATNRADVLDPALLRGGRFDRRISVSNPDVDGRTAILKVHSKNKKLASDVKLEDIAKITPGFVGADLENLLNEAAILAARRGSDTISMKDLDESVDKVGMGLGQKSKIISKRDKDMLAYHEGGHALIASILPNANKVHKVTIIPRGDAGGYMMPLPVETLGRTRKQILAEINVLFAGRAAEEVMMDDIATGAYSDIKRATDLAKLLITSVGMNNELGPINYEPNNDGFLISNDKSNETIREIDIEVRKLLKEKYQETLELIKSNKDILEKIANLLKQKETVTGSEIRAIISGLSVEEVLEKTNEELEIYY